MCVCTCERERVCECVREDACVYVRVCKQRLHTCMLGTFCKFTNCAVHHSDLWFRLRVRVGVGAGVKNRDRVSVAQFILYTVASFPGTQTSKGAFF